jgi:integrase
LRKKQQENLVAILAQCPVCKTRQSVKKKICGKCDHDLDKAKKGKRLIYWISYRLPSGKQKQEAVGTSIDEARAAEGKRKAQKKEGKLFDVKDDAKMTFAELAEWYKNLESIKAQKAFWRTKISLNHFISVHGNMIVSRIKPVDLENYQAKRKKLGKADNTVDSEIGAVRSIINKAFDNDMVSGETLKAFKRTKKLLKRNSNARTRILSHDEYEALCSHAALHVKHAVIIAYHTGMRRGEILQLRWPMVDMKARTITLEAYMTKDDEKRIIPISPSLYKTLKSIPKALHDDHVLMFRGKPLDTLGKALQRACVKAGILHGRNTKNGFIFHDLRHSFNTNM